MSDEVSCVYRSPLGPLKLVANAKGICTVKFLFGGHGRKLLGSVESEGEHDISSPPPVELIKGDPEAVQHLKTCCSWLDAYFNCTLDEDVAKPTLVIPHESKISARSLLLLLFIFAVAITGTITSHSGDFFNTVWTVLASTAVGETLSYKDLAKLAGRPHAARAVGRAMKSNRLPLLVPCHRVVRSNRSDIGCYSAGEGTKTKQWLLDHEKKIGAHNTSSTAS